MMGLFVAVGSRFGQSGMIMALVFGGLMNVVAWFFSDKIAIASMRGIEITQGQNPQLYNLVDELRQRAGLPMPRVYICEQPAPNAFATGRSPRKAAVAFTTGLLEMLNKEELEGVIAHELAHIKNRDTLTSCIAATISGVLATLAQFAMFFGGNRENSNPLVTLLTVVIAAFGAALIKAMISRSREFVADADAAAVCGTPMGLVGALQKLEARAGRIPLQNPNPAMNNLFIVEPFSGGGAGRALVNMFATHPPTERRIEALLSAR
jgi:heat shock protein HtpX